MQTRRPLERQRPFWPLSGTGVSAFVPPPTPSPRRLRVQSAQSCILFLHQSAAFLQARVLPRALRWRADADLQRFRWGRSCSLGPTGRLPGMTNRPLVHASSLRRSGRGRPLLSSPWGDASTLCCFSGRVCRRGMGGHEKWGRGRGPLLHARHSTGTRRRTDESRRRGDPRRGASRHEGPAGAEAVGDGAAPRLGRQRSALKTLPSTPASHAVGYGRWGPCLETSHPSLGARPPTSS